MRSTVRALGEFPLIKKCQAIFVRGTVPDTSVEVGIGDDAAVLRLPVASRRGHTGGAGDHRLLFASDMLVQSGGTNPFVEQARRYPRIDEDQLAAARPEVILLPTEPYIFGETDRLELLSLDCPASRDGRVHIVEGELLSWYGPRMGRALRIFSELFAG